MQNRSLASTLVNKIFILLTTINLSVCLPSFQLHRMKMVLLVNLTLTDLERTIIFEFYCLHKRLRLSARRMLPFRACRCAWKFVPVSVSESMCPLCTETSDSTANRFRRLAVTPL